MMATTSRCTARLSTPAAWTSHPQGTRSQAPQGLDARRRATNFTHARTTTGRRSWRPGCKRVTDTPEAIKLYEEASTAKNIAELAQVKKDYPAAAQLATDQGQMLDPKVQEPDQQGRPGLVDGARARSQCQGRGAGGRDGGRAAGQIPGPVGGPGAARHDSPDHAQQCRQECDLSRAASEDAGRQGQGRRRAARRREHRHQGPHAVQRSRARQGRS